MLTKIWIGLFIDRNSFLSSQIECAKFIVTKILFLVSSRISILSCNTEFVDKNY